MSNISRKLLPLLLIIISISTQAQYDTLRLMYYNVLDFPISDPGREARFRTINQFVKADILCITELKSAEGANLILNDALNIYGIDYYQMATYITGDFSENLIYFNSNKLGLVSQDVIYTSLRDINEYVLYYKSVDLAVTQDTVYFYFYIAHLKASQGFEQERLDEVNDFLTHLNGLSNPENVFFGGDFNLYGSSEPAYQAIINNSQVNLNDPLTSGEWHNNPTYSDIHTQSTRTVDFGNGSTGGLDDRFDFIFFTDDVNSGSQKVKYIPNSCKAFGNDGNHLNLDLIDPPSNPEVPDSVIQALYYGSDHLPVICDLRVEALSAVSNSKMMITEIMYNPPEAGLDSMEFIELYNGGALPENLEGFYFEQGIDFTFPAMSVNPGEFLVLALNADAVNNTFGVTALQWTSEGLSNSGELLLLKDNYGRTVDSVNYLDVAPWPTAPDGNGPSLMFCDPELDNSDPANWAASANFVTVNSNGDSIYASPGFNECGLTPVADFTASITTITAGEIVTFTDLSLNDPTQWNWTFNGGTPSTSSIQNPVITYNTSGSYLVSLAVSNDFGSDTEIRIDYIVVIDNSGSLIITEVMNNPADITDANGEWFEVFNPGNAPVDMDGWTIKDDGTDIHIISGSVIVPAKGFAVLGINSNTGSNGGFTCDYQYTGIYLGNSGDEIELLRPDNSQVDKILWDGGPSWPDLNGASMVFTGTTLDDNNDPVLWTAASLREETYPISGLDLGSPGTNGSEQNLVTPGIYINLHVFLEGAYNLGSMNSVLIGLDDFPYVQPYNVSPWFYTGSEGVTALPGVNIVDWILVEIRDAFSAATATSLTILATQAAFLRSDGTIINTEGSPDLFFDISPTQQLFVVIHHRNHLSVISAMPIEESGGAYSYDFTTSDLQAYNYGQIDLGDGNYGMISGDANADGTVDIMDKNDNWELKVGNIIYNRADLNLDAEINNEDKNECWYPNRGLGSQVPD